MSGGGSIGGSGRSKSSSSPGLSGSNVGFSKVTSSIAALTVDANLKVVAWLQIHHGFEQIRTQA